MGDAFMKFNYDVRGLAMRYLAEKGDCKVQRSRHG